jgi:hypothetical protein
LDAGVVLFLLETKMHRDKITVWVTKWALELGRIDEIEAEVCCGGMVNCGWVHGYLHRDEFQRTREAAVLQAEEMRMKEISSLKKQLDKLEKMRFE